MEEGRMSLSLEQLTAYKSLRTVEKIAIFLGQLEKETTAAILSEMDIGNVETISKQIAVTGVVDKELAHAVLKEFDTLLEENPYVSSGGMAYAKGVLHEALGSEDAKKILERLSRELKEERHFDYLAKVEPGELAAFVKEEHPQTIALILAHLDARSAAKTLEFFSEGLKDDLLLRMAKIREISPEIVAQVSELLESKLDAYSAADIPGGVAAVANVISHFTKGASKETLEHLARLDAELASQIKRKVFGFEEIALLDNRSVREILRAVDKRELMMALKSAPEELKEKFFANMAQPARVAFVEEMRLMGAVKVKAVKSAQEKIVDALQRLVTQGAVVLNNSDELVE
jgi:flagellar motor switch protein FliG